MSCGRDRYMSDYRMTYSQMSDDQLLNVAHGADLLVPEANTALKSELRERKFGLGDITAQVEHFHTRSLEAARRKPFARTCNGFGTMTYGKRDPEPDGSFLTTKWAVAFWIPLIPLRSFRVKYVGPGLPTFLPGWSRVYLVLASHRPSIIQTVSTYSYVGSLLVGGWVIDSICFGSNEGRNCAKLGALALWLFTPWLLRIRSRVSP
jgi:hypothetical protein